MNNNSYHWFLLLFLAVLLAVFGIKSTSILSMAFFLASIALLVAGIGRLEKTLEEMAVEEESEEAEEKEAKNEEELGEGEKKFRLNEELRIREEMTALSKMYTAGRISKTKYQKEIEGLRNELEELKSGVELHLFRKKRRKKR